MWMVTYQRYVCGQTRSDIGTDTDGLALFTLLIHLMMLAPLITQVSFSVFHLLPYGLVSNKYSSMQQMHMYMWFTFRIIILSLKYVGDCHDTHGVKDMCVAGAIKNFTSQLSHYHHGTSDRRCKYHILVFGPIYNANNKTDNLTLFWFC